MARKKIGQRGPDSIGRVLAALEPLAPAEVTRVVRQTFDRMAVAEEVIAEEKKKVKGEAEKALVHGAFGIRFPTPVLRDKSEDVYRAHVRELVGRLLARQDTRPGTAAEVLSTLSAVSLVRKLSPLEQGLMERLFVLVLPKQAEEVGAREWGGDWQPHYLAHEQEVLYRELRTRLHVEDRRRVAAETRVSDKEEGER